MKKITTLLLLVAAFGAAAAERARAHTEPVAQIAASDQVVPMKAGSAPATREGAALPAAPIPAASDSLPDRVAALQRKVSAWDKILARLPRISGYVQVGYEYADAAKAGGSVTSTFFIKRVRLNLTGDIVPKIDYRVQIEFASPKIVDAYLNLRPWRGLNLRIGEFKIPFSIENTDYVPLKFELIEYPLALRKMMGFSDLCGLSATGRDLGAMLYGGFFARDGYNILNYDIGVFNGEGINSKDRNSSKDIAARLSLQPLCGWQFSGSWYRGEYGPDHLHRIRYAAGMCYDRGAAVLRGEWIGGRTGALKSAGWYVLGGWRVCRTVMPVVRYDTFLENTAASASRQTNYTAGVVWQPVKYLRCQLNYTYEEYAAAGRRNRNAAALMLTGIF